MIIDKFANSILEARFNNKVEIEPIVKLISEYEKQFTDKNDLNNSTNGEFMALWSALSFSFLQIDADDYSLSLTSSNTLPKVWYYRTEFDIDQSN